MTAHRREPEPAGPLDAGLLSPVRAATPVEAEVDDRAWLRAMVEAEVALARAQARLGTVPAEAASVIAAVGADTEFDPVALARAARETANPVVGFVQALTAAVADRDAVAADYVHRGSTSQDVLDTAAMLVTRRAIAVIRADLARAATALARLAADHRDTPMAGRTLTLHAVPTTFGLKAAGWLDLVRQAADRLQTVSDTLPVELGGAAGTLAGYLEYAGHGEGTAGPTPAGPTPAGPTPEADRYAEALIAAYADELGLAVPLLPWHVLRAPLADIAAATSFLAGALGKIAVDVQSLARTEVGEVSEPGPAGRGASSAMPHKRNPVLATLIRSAALQLPQLAAGLYGCMLAEDERSGGAWHAEWQPLRECLRLAGGAAHTAAELLEGLTPHPERMRANLALTGGQIVSERVAARLTPALGKVRAKALLGAAAQTAAARGCGLAEVLAGLPDVTDHLTEEEIHGLLDPARYTGAARALTDRALRGPGRGTTDTPSRPSAGPQGSTTA